MEDGDEMERRTTDVGGRRATDPPGVPLREYLETLLRGVQVQLDLAISGLGEKLDNHMRQQSREHVEVMERLGTVETKVDSLEIERARQEGEVDQRGRDYGALRWVAQWLPSVIAVAIAAWVAFHG